MLKKLIVLTIVLISVSAQAMELKKGPNHLQKAPVLVSAQTNGLRTLVRGKMNAKNAAYIIQFFSNTSNRNPAITEGKLFLGQIKLKMGQKFFKACLPCTNEHSFISATATRSDHKKLTDTSKFSLNIEVTA